MRNLKSIILILVLSFTISACQTIKNKTDEIVEKENQKLTKYIGKTSSLLKMELGAPSEDFKNEKGNLILVYNTKKYGIPCERRFEGCNSRKLSAKAQLSVWIGRLISLERG